MILPMVLKVGGREWSVNYESDRCTIPQIMAILASHAGMSGQSLNGAEFSGAGNALIPTPDLLPSTIGADEFCTRCGHTDEIETCACGTHEACRQCDYFDCHPNDDSMRFYCDRF